MVKRDALNTGLGATSIDTALLFGVLSLACIALKSAFARNAPRPETRREVSRMVVSGFRLGAKIDPSVRVIHVHKQTKRSLQLQAMLRAHSKITRPELFAQPSVV